MQTCVWCLGVVSSIGLSQEHGFHHVWLGEARPIGGGGALRASIGCLAGYVSVARTSASTFLCVGQSRSARLASRACRHSGNRRTQRHAEFQKETQHTREELSERIEAALKTEAHL